MSLLRRSAYMIVPFVLSVVFGQVDIAQSTSQSTTAPPSTAGVVPLEPPVSRSVLEDYLRSAGTLEANKALAQVSIRCDAKNTSRMVSANRLG
jgi:hypothetical protein